MANNIIAFGRYNTIRTYCFNNGLKCVSRKEYMGKTSCTNSKRLSKELKAVALDFAGVKIIKDKHVRIWFNCWLAVKE